MVTIALLAGAANGCTKGGSAPLSESPSKLESIPAHAEEGMSGCDHDVESRAIVKHAWPFPARARDVRWGTTYEKMKLKLKPRSAAFVTATVTWKKGELIEVEDSEIVIRKPRRVTAKHDVFIVRKVWEQGVALERTVKVASAGDATSFLFYNSRGHCMILTDEGPAWTTCTLGESFEEVTPEQPFACQQTWWIKVRKSKVHKGWMPFDDALMQRVSPQGDAAR